MLVLVFAFDVDFCFRCWLYRFTPPALSCGGVKTGVFSPVLVGGAFDFLLWFFRFDFLLLPLSCKFSPQQP